MKKYEELNFNIVLIEPEIPTNTGNIGRTCVGTNSKLHIVGPLGFEINDKRLKRAGLDYWQHLEWQYYETYEEFLAEVSKTERMFFFSTKVDRAYTEVQYEKGDWLIFGKETKGLAPSLLESVASQVVTIPMPGQVRSLNLSNSVAIALFEGLRQVSQK